MDFKQYGLSPIGAVPNERQLKHFKMGKKAFIHFGMNTFTNVEWGNGKESPASFNPTALDARQWVRSLKAAGFELIILTAKHHDGFCLWPSAVTEHSVQNSPYKKDIVKEFTDACREYHVKAGLYLSPWDRNSPYWGRNEYNDYYAAQLTELLTGYGPIYEIWWDGAGSTETSYDWKRWVELIRKYQPEASIFGSLGASEYVDFRWVGNEQGRAGETHYASLDLCHLQTENTKWLYTGNQGAPHYIPSETDVSIRPGWFHRPEQDSQVKTAKQLNKIWFESVGRNSLLLLNFPPNQKGLICQKDLENAMESHRRIAKMLAVNYAADAVVTADSVLCPACSPDKATLNDDTLFYAAEKEQTTIDIVLPQEQVLNVLCLGEMVQLGERISRFTVQEVTGETVTEIAAGTSVGYYRAVKLPEKAYSHLRVRIDQALAAPVLRTLELHFFEDAIEEAPASTVGMNLAEFSAAQVSFSEDSKTVQVAFGGVYPFDYVRFVMESAGEYELFCFDGTDYQPVYKGSADKKTGVKILLPQVQEGSYQIKICATAELSQAAGVQVKLYPGEQKK